MSIRTKIDFSGITSDHIVTSDNKKYIHEDDEIFNSLKDEIAACENAQVQTELATLEILDIKEQTKVIANEAIDTATERAETAAQNAETAAQNAETAQALSELAAINALESERNVIEFSETLARLDEDNTFTGNNNFTGTLTVNDEEVLTSSNFDNFVKLDEDNTFTGNNNFTGSLTINGDEVLITSDANSFAKLSSNNTFSGTNNFTGSLTKNGNEVLTTSDASSFAKTNTNNTFSGTNNFTGTLLVGGKDVLTSEDTSNFAKLNVDNNFTGALTVNNKSVLTSSDSTVFAKTNANNTFSGTNNFTGSLTINNNNVLTANDVTSFVKTNANNTFSGTNNFTGTLQSKGNTVLTTSDASNYFKLNAANTITKSVYVDTNTKSLNIGYGYDSLQGSFISFSSIDNTSEAETNRGAFKLVATDGTNRKWLFGRSNGNLSWDTLTINNNNFLVSDNATYFNFGYDVNKDNNPRLSLYSKDNTVENNKGAFVLSANNGTNKYQLVGRASDGGLFWGGNRIVTQYNPHSIYFDHTNGTSKDIGYATGNNNTKRGAYMTFWNGDDASNAGTFRLAARDETKHINLMGTTSGSLTWNNSEIPTVGSNNTFTGTNNFTGTLQSKGNTVLTTSDASNYFKLNAANTITSNILVKDTTKYINFGYEYNSRTGAVLALHSINHDTESARGAFSLYARDANNNYLLQGRAYDGALLWKGKHVITQDTPHNLFFDQTSGTYKYLGYNQDSNKTVSGSYLKFNNANDTSAPGHLTIAARNLEKQATLGLSPDGTLTWTGSVISIGNKPAVTKISSGQATSVWHNHLSSGLLIQSNICPLSANATSDTITLSKPFDNTEYVVFVIFEDDKSNDATGVLSIMNKTTTSFKIHNGNGKGTYRWIAIGHSLDFS